MADFRLDWRAPKHGEMVFTPITQIRLGIHASDAIGPLVTPQCVSPQELEWNVRYLQRQLDRLLVQAKKKYAAHRAKETAPCA